MTLRIELTDELARFSLPEGVKQRLDDLLDKQDEGCVFSAKERAEAEGLVELSEFLSLLKLRSKPQINRLPG